MKSRIQSPRDAFRRGLRRGVVNLWDLHPAYSAYFIINVGASAFQLATLTLRSLHSNLISP